MFNKLLVVLEDVLFVWSVLGVVFIKWFSVVLVCIWVFCGVVVRMCCVFFIVIFGVLVSVCVCDLCFLVLL